MITRVRGWLRSKWHLLTLTLMSRCRTCGSSTDVVSYDPRGLWAFFRRKTYCPKHCPDHDYAYDRGEHEWCCQICHDPAPPDFWAYHPD